MKIWPWSKFEKQQEALATLSHNYLRALAVLDEKDLELDKVKIVNAQMLLDAGKMCDSRKQLVELCKARKKQVRELGGTPISFEDLLE